MTALATVTQNNTPAIMAEPVQNVGTAVLMNDGLFTRMSRIAEVMASGKCTVPKHLQGQPGDCFAIGMQALRWGMDPYVVAQKTHLVNGTLGYEAQLVSAIITKLAPIQGRPRYEWGTDERGRWCTASVTGTDGHTYSKTMYERDQTVKNSPLWKTDVDQQLAYLTIKRLARLYFPDVLLGVYTDDELQDAIIDIPAATTGGQALASLTAQAETAVVVDAATGEVFDSLPDLADAVMQVIGNATSVDDLAAQWGAARDNLARIRKEDKALFDRLVQAKELRKQSLTPPPAAPAAEAPECAAWSPQQWNEWEMNTSHALSIMDSGQDVSSLYHGEKPRLDWLQKNDQRRWANVKQLFDRTADKLA